jgi:hypothetical protein
LRATPGAPTSWRQHNRFLFSFGIETSEGNGDLFTQAV